MKYGMPLVLREILFITMSMFYLYVFGNFFKDYFLTLSNLFNCASLQFFAMMLFLDHV